MLSSIYDNSKVTFKLNFGFGKVKQRSVAIRLGFNSNFFFNLYRNSFKFIQSKKVNSTFFLRAAALTKKDLTLFSTFFNSNFQKQIVRRVGLLKSNRSWRGIRHLQGLPVRGQRTKTNARTCKLKRAKRF